MKAFFRKKIIVGVISMLLAFGLTFFIAPRINESKNEAKNVLVFSSDFKAGSKINESMLKVEERGVYGSSNYLLEEQKSEVLDYYLKVDVEKGDMIQTTKVSKDSSHSNYLEEIPEGKTAISFTVQSFAKGLSAKLLPNDIIRIISVIKEESHLNVNTTDHYKGDIRNELNYVKVLSVTYPTAVDLKPDDKRDENTSEKQLPVTITVLADNTQAKSIAELELKGSIHVALVHRGVDFEKYLTIQDEINQAMSQEDKSLIKIESNPENLPAQNLNPTLNEAQNNQNSPQTPVENNQNQTLQKPNQQTTKEPTLKEKNTNQNQKPNPIGKETKNKQ